MLDSECRRQSPTSSSNSSISNWLEAQPELPQHYDDWANAHRSKLNGIKRKRKGRFQSHSEDQQNPLPRFRKRRPLAITAGNTMTPRRSPRILPVWPPSTPPGSTQSKASSKRKRQSKEHPLYPHPRHHPLTTEVDEEQTPRPSRPVMLIPNLSHPGIKNLQFDQEQDTPSPSLPASSATGSSATGSSAAPSTRTGRSPTRRMGDFQFADVRIEMKSLGAHGNTIPPESESLCSDMRKIYKARHIIPLAVRDKMKEIGEEVDSIDLDMTDESHEASEARGRLSPAALWSSAVELREIASDCQQKDAPEATWNSEVYSRLFRLALRGWWQSKGIWYQDATTARIRDTSLLPSVATKPMQSKLVDYVLLIEPTANMKDRIIAKIIGHGKIPSVNQTSAEYLRFTPMVVSIETKRAGIDEDTAHVQLGTWTVALFARLKQLTKGKATSLPVLPVIVVQGHRWQMMLASMMNDHRVEILGDFPLGETGSVTGVYQVIAAIRRLARWIDEQYRPWFEKDILDVSILPKTTT